MYLPKNVLTQTLGLLVWRFWVPGGPFEIAQLDAQIRVPKQYFRLAG